MPHFKDSPSLRFPFQRFPLLKIPRFKDLRFSKFPIPHSSFLDSPFPVFKLSVVIMTKKELIIPRNML